MSFDSHRALEAGLGLVLLVVPFLFSVPGDVVDFSTAAIVVAAVIGLVLATLGFSGRRVGEAVPASTHAQFDRIVIGALLLAGVLFALDEQGEAVLLVAGSALAQTLLVINTRYSAR
jgi:hypothetical protein